VLSRHAVQTNVLARSETARSRAQSVVRQNLSQQPKEVFRTNKAQNLAFHIVHSVLF